MALVQDLADHLDAVLRARRSGDTEAIDRAAAAAEAYLARPDVVPFTPAGRKAAEEEALRKMAEIASSPKHLLAHVFLETRIEGGFDRSSSIEENRYVAYQAGIGCNSVEIDPDRLAEAFAEAAEAAFARWCWSWPGPEGRALLVREALAAEIPVEASPEDGSVASLWKTDMLDAPDVARSLAEHIAERVLAAWKEIGFVPER